MRIIMVELLKFVISAQNPIAKNQLHFTGMRRWNTFQEYETKLKSNRKIANCKKLKLSRNHEHLANGLWRRLWFRGARSTNQRFEL
jgi:hypothetical protein